MSVREDYNNWSAQYDSNENRTRDLEGFALRETLKNITFNKCLEIGCGTGKNTEWLLTKAQQVIAVDFSEGMLGKARERIISDNVHFELADIKEDWAFAKGK